MNKRVVCIIFFIVSSPATKIYGYQSDFQSIRFVSAANNASLIQNQNTSELVKKAFEQIRKKQGRLLYENLEKIGEPVVPFLEPYLNDENTDIRGEAVNLALEIGGEKSLELIALALRNSDPEIQKSTAGRLYFLNSQFRKIPPEAGRSAHNLSKYQNAAPEKIAAVPQLGKALRESLKAGNVNAPVFYLLANFPDAETICVLKEISLKTSPELKPAALPAKIVLSGFGDREATAEILESINQNAVKTLLYFLGSIGEIKSSEVLSALVRTLDNKSDITGGRGASYPHRRLPNGISLQLPPARRLCDVAVNSFVERFYLNSYYNKLNKTIGFGLHSTVYQDKQIVQVREMVKRLLQESTSVSAAKANRNCSNHALAAVWIGKNVC